MSQNTTDWAFILGSPFNSLTLAPLNRELNALKVSGCCWNKLLKGNSFVIIVILPHHILKNVQLANLMNLMKITDMLSQRRRQNVIVVVMWVIVSSFNKCTLDSLDVSENATRIYFFVLFSEVMFHFSYIKQCEQGLVKRKMKPYPDETQTENN